MTIRVPYKLWAKAKCAETGRSEPSIRRSLRKRDFNGYRPVYGGTNLSAVEINCNRAGHLMWLGLKMDDKLKRRECACGQPGIEKNSDHSWTCADCKIKEAKYSRCMTSIAERRERNRYEDEIEENATKRLRLTAPTWD
jgi:hypothetical protein